MAAARVLDHEPARRPLHEVRKLRHAERHDAPVERRASAELSARRCRQARPTSGWRQTRMRCAFRPATRPAVRLPGAPSALYRRRPRASIVPSASPATYASFVPSGDHARSWIVVYGVGGGVVSNGGRARAVRLRDVDHRRAAACRDEREPAGARDGGAVLLGVARGDARRRPGRQPLDPDLPQVADTRRVDDRRAVREPRRPPLVDVRRRREPCADRCRLRSRARGRRSARTRPAFRRASTRRPVRSRSASCACRPDVTRTIGRRSSSSIARIAGLDAACGARSQADLAPPARRVLAGRGARGRRRARRTRRPLRPASQPGPRRRPRRRTTRSQCCQRPRREDVRELLPELGLIGVVLPLRELGPVDELAQPAEELRLERADRQMAAVGARVDRVAREAAA